MRLKSTATALAALLTLPTSLLAGPSPAPTPASETPWEFRVGLPLWAGAPSSGDAAAGSLAAPLDVTVGDLIRHIDMAFALSFEARRGRWAVTADGLYLRLSDSVHPRGPLIHSARLEIEQTLAEAALNYRAVDRDAWTLDAFAGARYNHVGLKFDLDAAPERRGDTHASGSKDWADPFVGLQLRAKLCRPVTFVLKGDVGGFGIASDFTWQGYAGLEFQLSPRTFAGVGWRHLHTDYQDGNFNYDTNTTGPQLEFGLKF